MMSPFSEADQQGVYVMINALRLASVESEAECCPFNDQCGESGSDVAGHVAGHVGEHVTEHVTGEFAARFDSLLDELKKLRKGRGIFAVDIERRVGPTLRAVAGIDADDGPTEIRNKIARRLQNLANSLPADLRIATLAAFAIASDARQPLYKDRVDLTASRIGRDPRTARRRMDEAIVQLTQVATARIDEVPEFVAAATTDWYYTELVVSLIVDRDRPEIVEQGRVVAETDQVTELPLHTDLMLSCAAEQIVVEPDVVYGGNVDQPRAADRRRTPLTLARPLERGQSHEYEVRQRIVSRRALRPEVCYVPSVRCDRFVLRVRFPRTAAPTHAVRLGRASELLMVDGFGELQVEFRDLAAGQSYGVRWEWPEPATPRPRPPVARLAVAGSPGSQHSQHGEHGHQLCAATNSSPRQMPAITPITRHAADTFSKDATEQNILIAALPSSCAEPTGGRRFHGGRGVDTEKGVASAQNTVETGNIED